MDYEQETSADMLGAEGIFLRGADRKRFEYVMRAVCEEGQCLALSSQSDDLLDHYGRIVINKLRHTPSLQIEVFLPANTEALLDRFNQILSGLSLTDARNGESSPAPRRVLIAHDAKAVETRDLQLLSRLINDFPGANTSLVLLLDRAGTRLHERTLENFGKRMLHWPVEAPTRGEGDALLKLARGMGFEVEVKKLLARTGFTEPVRESISEAPPVFAQQLAAVRRNNQKKPAGRTEPVLGQNDSQERDATPASVNFTPALKRGRSMIGTALRWIVAIVLLITVSAAVIGLLFPQRLVPLLATSPLVRENVPPWLLTAALDVLGKPEMAPAADAALPVVPAPLPAPAPAAALPEATPAIENTTQASVPPASSDSSPVGGMTEATDAGAKTALPKTQGKSDSGAKTEPVAPVVPVAPVAAVAPVGAVPKIEPLTKIDPAAKLAPIKKSEPIAKIDTANKPEPAKVTTIAEALAPRSESGVQQLVQQARAGSYFVQHVSLTSMAEAQEWRAQYPALAKSRIAAVGTQDQGAKFAVVSGPFASRKEAEVFASRPGVPADPWLRPLTSLQKALQADGR
jgi:hypothetical protein